MHGMQKEHSSRPAQSAATHQNLLGHLLRDTPGEQGQRSLKILPPARTEKPRGSPARAPGQRPELLKVRKGHVVGLKPPGSKWQLAVVVRATQQGRATHACPASLWDPGMKVTSDTRLAGAQVAVLPPEWAGNQELAAELEDQRFPFLEDLREAVVGREA